MEKFPAIALAGLAVGPGQKAAAGKKGFPFMAKTGKTGLHRPLWPGIDPWTGRSPQF